MLKIMRFQRGTLMLEDILRKYDSDLNKLEIYILYSDKICIHSFLAEYLVHKQRQGHEQKKSTLIFCIA